MLGTRFGSCSADSLLFLLILVGNNRLSIETPRDDLAVAILSFSSIGASGGVVVGTGTDGCGKVLDVPGGDASSSWGWVEDAEDSDCNRVNKKKREHSNHQRHRSRTQEQANSMARQPA